MRDEPPLIRLPRQNQVESTLTATQDLTVKIPRGAEFYVSVSVVNTAEGATLEFRAFDQGATPVPVIVGAELGTTRYIAPFEIVTITLRGGASGGTLAVWIKEDVPIERC